MASDATAPNRRAVIGGISALLLPLAPARLEAAEQAAPKQTVRAAPAKLKLYPEAAEPADVWVFDGRCGWPTTPLPRSRCTGMASGVRTRWTASVA
jgi:hypothetical protein